MLTLKEMLVGGVCLISGFAAGFGTSHYFGCSDTIEAAPHYPGDTMPDKLRGTE